MDAAGVHRPLALGARYTEIREGVAARVLIALRRGPGSGGWWWILLDQSGDFAEISAKCFED
jgi:hypothetical protein